MEKRIGTYRILEEVATGGHATVYRAWDTKASRTVAIKVLHPHLSKDPLYLERFQREATLASSIRHPNIVQIYEVGKVRNAHFIAMEYLPMTLFHLLKGQAQLPVNRAIQVAHHVCLGLNAASKQGIVHRDIKPQNVLMGTEGTVKITDFGIARAHDLATMTQTGLVMGTPQYMAPEQARGEPPDVRSDIYSVGILLYQMLTGRLPFEGENPWEVIRKHVEETPGSVQQFHPEVPEELGHIVHRCLQKDPNDRYQSPIEVAQKLQEVRATEGIPEFDEVYIDPLLLERQGVQGHVTLPLPPSRWIYWLARARSSPVAATAIVTLTALIVLGLTAGSVPRIRNLLTWGSDTAPVVIATPTAVTKPDTGPKLLPSTTQPSTPIAAVPTFATSSPAPSLGTVFRQSINATGAGETMFVALTEEDQKRIGLAGVQIVTRQAIPDSTLVVRRLEQAPTSERPPGAIFSYLDITLEGVNQGSIDTTSVIFQVPVRWLESNDVGKRQISLYKFDGRWVRLATIASFTTSEFVTYTADTGGFSIFAISATTETLATPTAISSSPVPTPLATVAAMPTPVPLATAPVPTTVPTPATPTPTPIPLEERLVINHSGSGGSEETPLFGVFSSPWKLQYRTSWTGKLRLVARDTKGSSTLVEHNVREGLLYETFIYDSIGILALSVPDAGTNHTWNVWVTDSPATDPSNSPFDPPGTVFSYVGTSHARSPSFEVATSPWKLQYQATWTGPFGMVAEGPQGTVQVIRGEVAAGVIYQTFVYGTSGNIRLAATGGPPEGRWLVSAVDNPALPLNAPIFTFTGTGQVNSPPFQSDQAPWKLAYTTSWSGPFNLIANGKDTPPLVQHEVTAGVIYETHIYDLLGPIYLGVTQAPASGSWSIAVNKQIDREANTAPGGPPEAVFGYNGTGNTTGPPLNINSLGWKIMYRVSWEGRLIVKSDERTLVDAKVRPGITFETAVTGLGGPLHFTVSAAPPSGTWSLWVVEDPQLK